MTAFDPAVIGARLGVAARGLGVADADLVTHVADVTGGALRDVLVWTDAELAVLGLASGLAADDPLLPRRMSVLTAGLGNSTAPSRTVMSREGVAWIERWSDGRAVVAVMGPATLDDDLAALIAIGANPDAVRTLATRLGAVTDPARALRLVRTTVVRGDVETYELGVQAPAADVLERVSGDAPSLGIGAAQLKMFMGVHPILSHGTPVLVRAGVRGGELLPGLSITYGAQSIETMLRVVTGLAVRTDTATRLGTLTGALGCERVAALELQLGPVDPAAVRFALEVATG